MYLIELTYVDGSICILQDVHDTLEKASDVAKEQLQKDGVSSYEILNAQHVVSASKHKYVVNYGNGHAVEYETWTDLTTEVVYRDWNKITIEYR